MASGEDRFQSYGFYLGDIDRLGGTVRGVLYQLDDILARDFPLLEYSKGGDQSIEEIVLITVKGSTKKQNDEGEFEPVGITILPSPEALWQLKEFARRYGIYNAHDWFEWRYKPQR